MALIAIDLGGTKLSSALVTPRGDVIARARVALGDRRGADVGALVVSAVRELVVGAPGGAAVEGVGVAVPGLYRHVSGTVWAPNIGGWDDYPLLAEVRQAVGAGVPVAIDSDRACSILGEAWLGAARGCRNAVFVAVGTGIGAGILVEGRVLRGHGDVAGAVGWMALDRPFRSGYRDVGCFEYHASGDGLARVARDMLAAAPDDASPLRARAPASLTAHDVFAAAAAGDALAAAVLDQAVGYWGMAAANLVSLFNPEVIVFGGGLFGPAVRLLDRIRAEATLWAQPIGMGEARLEGTALAGDAALYGAARVALAQTGPPLEP